MSDVQKEIALKVTTDTSQTQKAFANAQQELEETRKALVDLALAGKQSSEEFKRMEARAGQLQDAIGDINRRVTNLATDTPKLQLLTEAATGIAAGFSIAQGAAALFAGENEELQQAILKTQGAMALLNGVQSAANVLNKDSAIMMRTNAIATGAYNTIVGTTTGALKLFRVALAATGIGLAVVAVGALVANFDAVKKAILGFIESSAPLKAVIDFISRGFNRIGEALGILPSASEKATKQMIADLEKQKKLLEASGADTAALDKRLAELRIQLAKQTGEGLAEAEEELTLVMAAQNKKRADEQAEAAKKRLELEKQTLEKIKEQRLKDAENQKEIAQIAIDTQNQIKEREKNAAEELAKIDEERRRATLTDFQRRIEDIQADSAQRIELLRATGASETEIMMEQNRAIGLITKEFNDAEDAKHKEAIDKKKKREEEYRQNTIDLTKGGLQAIADITAAFAGQSEAEQKRAFDVQKKVNIAITLIDTYLAAQKAYLSQLQLTPDSPIRAAIAAAVAVAGGLARVAAIRNTTFGAASTSAAPQAIRPAGLPQGGSPPPAAFNPNTSSPIVPPQGQGGAGQPQGQRVYVLERDIRNVGQRVSAAERFATFG